MFDLKNTLKTFKTNESTISMLLGAIVVLIIGFMLANYIKGKADVNPGTNSPSTTQEAAQTENSNGKHKVVKGETLWQISEKYYQTGYNWVKIAETNSLANPNIIEVDQELTIPVLETATQATVEKTEEASLAQAQVAPTPATEQPGGDSNSVSPINDGSYAVVQGDHLWGIAVRAYGDGYQWVKIWRENQSQVQNPDIIYPGQNLVIPR